MNNNASENELGNFPKSNGNQDDQRAKNEKLRALLDGLDLTPEQTKDDIASPRNRDSEIMRDVPPHHGN